jgi:hypothetical protein
VSCNKPSHPEPGPASSSSAAASAATRPPESASPPPSAAPPPSASAPPSASPESAPVVASEASSKDYAWLESPDLDPRPNGTLEGRIAPPPGYERVSLEKGSFGAWLRGLPLAPEGTPVKTFDGKEVHGGDDDYVAGVIAIDVGKSDLQQSSDVVVRLHAEWLWSKQAIDSINYKASTKLDLPLTRWQKGQRIVTTGPTVFWAVKTKPSELTYQDFREFLAQVFAWGNSSSLWLGTEPVPDPAELAPGDFFLQPRGAGHAVIVLDLAKKPSGERVALLGQGLNPAQTPHILRPGRGTAWFSVRPPLAVVTPYTEEFGWSDLRRFKAP